MFNRLTRVDAVTAVPTSSESDVQNDLRKLVYAYRDPPATGPSDLERLKEQEIEGTDGATHYDSATAGWEPEPRYNAFQDNVDVTQLEAELDTLSEFVTSTPFEDHSVPLVGYLPPAVARESLNIPSEQHSNADGLAMGTVTNLYPTPIPDSGPRALQLEDIQTGLSDPTVAAIDESARPGDAPAESGWLSLSLLAAAWCPVPAPDDGALHIQPSNDINRCSKRGPHPSSSPPLSNAGEAYMLFEADVNDKALSTIEELDDNRVPIPAVTQDSDSWYVSEEHLTGVLATLLEEGHTISVTPVIEARDLPAEVRSADAPPLPWHSADSA